MNKNKKIIIGEWFEKAKNDELAIKAILKEKTSPTVVCFLSQQMAEKYLKSVLVFFGILPKTHDLLLLLEKCQEFDEGFVEFRESARLLVRYYIGTRYPEDFPEGFSIAVAKDAFEHAKKIKDFVHSFLFNKMQHGNKN